MDINIKELYERLGETESQNFTLSIEKEEDLKCIYNQKGKAYGAVDILYYGFISDTSEKSPFELFKEIDNLFYKYRESLSNEVFGYLPSVDSKSLLTSYKIFNSEFLEFMGYDASFSFWIDEEEEQEYFLVSKTSEEEGEFGYYGVLLLCRVESNLL